MWRISDSGHVATKLFNSTHQDETAVSNANAVIRPVCLIRFPRTARHHGDHTRQQDRAKTVRGTNSNIASARDKQFSWHDGSSLLMIAVSRPAIAYTAVNPSFMQKHPYS